MTPWEVVYQIPLEPQKRYHLIWFEARAHSVLNILPFFLFVKATETAILTHSLASCGCVSQRTLYLFYREKNPQKNKDESLTVKQSSSKGTVSRERRERPLNWLVRTVKIWHSRWEEMMMQILLFCFLHDLRGFLFSLAVCFFFFSFYRVSVFLGFGPALTVSEQYVLRQRGR